MFSFYFYVLCVTEQWTKKKKQQKIINHAKKKMYTQTKQNKKHMK